MKQACKLIINIVDDIVDDHFTINDCVQLFDSIGGSFAPYNNILKSYQYEYAYRYNILNRGYNKIA